MVPNLTLYHIQHLQAFMSFCPKWPCHLTHCDVTIYYHSAWQDWAALSKYLTDGCITCVKESGLITALVGDDMIKHWWRERKTDSFNQHFWKTSSVPGCVLGSMDPRDKDQPSPISRTLILDHLALRTFSWLWTSPLSWPNYHSRKVPGGLVCPSL